ncbi:TPA: heme-binding protein [Klebsiella variicola subsp. variicola]|nr:heme-binding protein [Klebsiella variicola subsp. variicola]HCI6297407.1 heme-binding protein [Klebsiella variicola subsp. variicola]
MLTVKKSAIALSLSLASCFAFAQGSTVLSEQAIARMSTAAHDEARKLGVDISFSVVDEKGWPVYFHRYNNAMLMTTVLVPNKAYTSAVSRMPSGDLQKLAAPGAPLYGINTADPKIILFAGGYPLVVKGEVVGAIGVGGGSWEQDEQMGKAALKAFDALQKP